jgi:hypothetical protein
VRLPYLFFFFNKVFSVLRVRVTLVEKKDLKMRRIRKAQKLERFQEDEKVKDGGGGLKRR